MNRIDKIISSPCFRQAIEQTELAEADRIYCLHGLDHAVDVARISYIISLEEKLDIKKDVIYAAALLHDSGRFRQYCDGTPHQTASMELAKQILPECGYDETEIAEILSAIDCHRHGKTKNRLGEILQKADNLSRLCFNCKARSGCKWSSDEMNMTITY